MIREQERKIEIVPRNVQILAYVQAPKQKKKLNYTQFTGKQALSVVVLTFSHWQKTAPKGEFSKK